MRFMKPGLLVAALFASASAGLLVTFAGQVSPMQSTPPAASSTPSQPDARVLVTISSKNRGTLPVPVKTDFVVLDNHRAAEIKELRPLKDEPMIFSLLVDASASMKSKSASQTAGAIKLFSALSSPNNHGYLILFRNGVVTSDEFVDASIAELLLTRGSERAQSTGLYDAIDHAIKKQLTLPQNVSFSRRAIFVFSDGADNASHTTLQSTITTLQTEGIAVFCIDTPTDGRESEKTRGLHTLRSLSWETGGDVVSLDDSGAFVSRLLDSTSDQYILSFSAPLEKHHDQHSLEVKSVSKDVKITAPTHFVAP
jgi:VWFA-related protein